MERLCWDTKDPMYYRVCKAYDALHALSVECHYASCESGVGKPRLN